MITEQEVRNPLREQAKSLTRKPVVDQNNCILLEKNVFFLGMEEHYAHSSVGMTFSLYYLLA